MKNNRIIGRMVGTVSWKLRWEKESDKPVPLWLTIRSLICREKLYYYRPDSKVPVFTFTSDFDEYCDNTWTIKKKRHTNDEV